ncbi:unnamed protein product [Cuscuta epithymum]|uniref:Peptidase A1 domain-containing protein n=1 Tax=Cuscuta epithymum TaxID=186058 RepID=A0AAV0CXR6_9ASTE|nr:unnamed protein product [Cuscuta epithymum]
MATDLNKENLLAIFVSLFGTLIILNCAAQEINQNNGVGAFTVELLHRDSPSSPLHDPRLSQWHRIHAAFQNSLARRLEVEEDPSIRVLPDPKAGTYLVRLSVGAAPAVKLAVADTGSDMIWLQCRHPCNRIQCSGDQHNESPSFNPNASVTYKPVHCQSQECSGLPGSRCARANNTCLYSASEGEVAMDTLTLDLATEMFNFQTGELKGRQSMSFPDIIFGCGHTNHFADNDTRISGIVGLGSSRYSLINQIGGNRFSYCLVPLSHLNVSSKLQFGSHPAIVVRDVPGVVSTPLILKPPRIFYYLTLLGISVGNQTVVPTTGGNHQQHRGNIYIDSGTTFSFLPTDMYLGLEETVKSSIGQEPMKPDTKRRFLRLCYQGLQPEDVPVITAHFEGGDLKLNPVNSFVNVGDGIGCLAFAPTEGVPVFGNVAHTNFLVEYDLEKMLVSFMPTDCAKWKY